MKIITLSAALCLAAAAVATDIHNPSIVEPDSLVKRTGPRAVSRHEDQHKSSTHNEHGVEAHNDGGKKGHRKSHKEKEDDNNEEEDGKEKKGDDDKKSGDDKKDSGDDKKKGGEDDKKTAEEDKKNGGEGTDASKKGPGGTPAVGTPAVGKDSKPIVDGKNGASVPNPATNPNIPKDFASPLWLVQPYGASIWEQGRTYVISWGPNPDPVYAKNLQDKSPVDIHLMRGPPDRLTEVQVLKTGVDSSVHMFQWTVPATVTPANDYTIRITHAGDLDTYSHYFEIVKAGDPRSSKSNVGEPLEMPKKGDTPQDLNKGKPAAPPNPFPDGKPATPATDPAAKPVKENAATDSKSPNIMAFALTLFGAVYFL